MMKRIWLHLLACTLTAGPAAAQEVTLRSGNWDMLRGDGKCAARLSGENATLTVWQFGDGRPSVTLSGPQFGAPSQKPGRLRIAIVEDARTGRKALRFDVAARPAPEGLTFDAGAGLMAAIWDADEVSVLTRGDPAPIARFAPGANGYPADELRRCREESARVDRGSGKPEATLGRPLVPVDQIVTSEDYPKRALRSELTGRSTLALTVSAQGLVSGCTILASSGHTMLDHKACILFSRRARFSPALDAAGAPTEARYVAPVIWMIAP